MTQNSVRKSVQEYYGKTLESNEDLKTNACCLPDAMPGYLREKLDLIHPEILDKFYGCGWPIPSELEGKTVLDLGCGTGRDCYLLSQLVGESGQVIGVDMTDEQLSVARKHQEHQKEKFGFGQSNVKFLHGYIEDLESLGIASESVDVVISNCVINLSPNKEKVFREIFRILKPGGELYYSDVFSDRRIPEPLKKDPVLVGECLGGALYFEDFRRLLISLGCHDYRIFKTSPIQLDDSEIEKKLSGIQFYSLTVRAPTGISNI